MADRQPFWILGVKFFIGYPCVRHCILFYIHGPVILHFLLSKYYKIQNANGYFEIV